MSGACNCLSCQLVPPRDHLSRKLELRMELNSNLSNSVCNVVIPSNFSLLLWDLSPPHPSSPAQGITDQRFPGVGGCVEAEAISVKQGSGAGRGNGWTNKQKTELSSCGVREGSEAVCWAGRVKMAASACSGALRRWHEAKTEERPRETQPSSPCPRECPASPEPWHTLSQT